jgi:hypothetical protein
MESRKNRTHRVKNIMLHEQSYEEVSSFKCLFSVVSYNSDITDDIKPVVTYRSKVWTVTDRTASVPMTWKRKILSHI